MVKSRPIIPDERDRHSSEQSTVIYSGLQRRLHSQASNGFHQPPFRATVEKKIKPPLSFSFQHNRSKAIIDCDEEKKRRLNEGKKGRSVKINTGGLRYSLRGRSDKHTGPFGVISHNTVSEVKGRSCHAGSRGFSSSRPHCWNRRLQNISRWSIAKKHTRFHCLPIYQVHTEAAVISLTCGTWAKVCKSC